jgi:hypothetical protein
MASESTANVPITVPLSTADIQLRRIRDRLRAAPRGKSHQRAPDRPSQEAGPVLKEPTHETTAGT